MKLCNSTDTPIYSDLFGNYSPAAEFYVFVGVTAFLYCIGMLLFYVFGDDKYRNIDLIPIVVSTGVFFSVFVAYDYWHSAGHETYNRCCLEVASLLHF